jgi:hypothetical protein
MREAIGLAVWRPAPNRIPLSDPDKVKLRNYGTAELRDGSGYVFVVDYVTSRGVLVDVLAPDGGEPSRATILNSALPSFRLAVRHYLREIEVAYTSPLEYVVHRWFGAQNFYLLRDRLTALIYGVQPLARRDRMAVLKAFAAASLRKSDARFSEITIGSQLHGDRWVLHSASDQTQRYFRMVLESLAATGDLKARDLGYYELAGRGLATLSEYEIEDRRHRQTNFTQWILAILTLALLVIGAGGVVVDLMNGQFTHGMFGTERPS